jgi:hypothetical protein
MESGECGGRVRPDASDGVWEHTVLLHLWPLRISWSRGVLALQMVAAGARPRPQRQHIGPAARIQDSGHAAHTKRAVRPACHLANPEKTIQLALGHENEPHTRSAAWGQTVRGIHRTSVSSPQMSVERER